MKLRKNDYLALRKSGIAAIDAKILELRLDIQTNEMLKMKNELKNTSAIALSRTAIAKLNTIKAELKEGK